MPRPRRRTRSSRAINVASVIAFLLVSVFAVSYGSGTARAEGEPSPEVTSEPTIPPTDPPTECGGYGSAGPVPSGSQSISGTVTHVGAPQPGIQVFLSEFQGGLISTETTPTGEYAFTGLGNGDYWIAFHDPTGAFRDGFYDGVGSPTVLHRDDGELVSLTGAGAAGISADLDAETLRTITGSVSDHASNPVNGAELRADGVFLPIFGCATNDTSFSMTDVRSGVYYIKVSAPGYPLGFYKEGAPGNFTTHGAEATQLLVDADVSAIDIEFPELFSLTGFVLDGGGTPKDGFYIDANEIPPGAFGFGSSAGNGTFSIDGLPAGDYHIFVTDGYAVHRSGWYAGDGAPLSGTETGAATVAVPGAVPGTPIEILAELAPVVTGHLENEDGDPVADVSVSLCDADQAQCGSGSTNALGDFSASILMPGTYYAQTYDGTNSYPNSGYITPSNGLIDPDFGNALPIVVGESGDVSGINGVLPYGGTITVEMTSDGAHLDYANANFCRSEDACGDGPATYDGDLNVVSAVYFAGSTFYVKEDVDYDGDGLWLVDGGTASPDFGDATLVTVVAGATTLISSDLPPAGTETPVGDPVIDLDDGSGTNPIEMSFTNVDPPGVTSVNVTGAGPTVPDGFQLGVPATYYDFTTTAVFDEVVICIDYGDAGTTFIDEANLRLFHYDDGLPGWIDITILPVDTVNDVICGLADSLSPFALAERTYQFGGFFGPKSPPTINEAKAGSIVGLQFDLGGDLGLGVLADGSPVMRRIDCATGASIGDDATATGSLKYNRMTARYTYNWDSLKAWKNTCREITLTFRDGTSVSLWYRFKP